MIFFLDKIFKRTLVSYAVAISKKSKKKITRTDGYNSYLIIIDRVTRYTWISYNYLKCALSMLLNSYFKKIKIQHPHRTVRIDQGGELGGCIVFKELLAGDDMGFSLELTGSDASA